MALGAAVAQWLRHPTMAGMSCVRSQYQKTRRVGQRCTLNLSRAETSSRWCGVIINLRNSIFTAEALAICQALDDLSVTNKNLLIISDSLSVLSSL
ncbi:hypothetical protein TNCV_549861 [Trichonephila clavipes]|nr:hypothetical protein TNCV_549861 [Trichonephila clavipes]